MHRFAIFFLIFISSKITCQTILPCCDVLATTGSSAEKQGVFYAWTVGETAIFTVSNSVVTFSQGFHQPDLCKPEIISAPDLPDNFTIEIFPNPTPSRLNIHFSGDALTQFNFQIFNVLGKKIGQNGQVFSDQNFEMDCSNFPPGPYFLKLKTPSGKSVGTFRFVKI